MAKRARRNISQYDLDAPPPPPPPHIEETAYRTQSETIQIIHMLSSVYIEDLAETNFSE